MKLFEKSLTYNSACSKNKENLKKCSGGQFLIYINNKFEGVLNMHASVKNTLLATAGAAAALAGSSVVASADSVTVKSGDTLYAIAAAHHVSVDELVSANKIADANMIITGDKVELPGSSSTSASSVAPKKQAAKGSSYTVKSGDTLWAIANANGMTLSELLSANEGLQASSTIFVGDSLNLTASATKATVSAPAASSVAAKPAATSTANASQATAKSAAAQSVATSTANASEAAAKSAAAQSAATSTANASEAAAKSAAAQSDRKSTRLNSSHQI